MKASFRSSDYLFRPTLLGLTLFAVGFRDLQGGCPMVREAKRTGLLRAKTDSFNRKPSVLIPNIPTTISVPGAFGRSLNGNGTIVAVAA